jgi:hypothetical protein
MAMHPYGEFHGIFHLDGPWEKHDCWLIIDLKSDPAWLISANGFHGGCFFIGSFFQFSKTEAVKVRRSWTCKK